MRAGAPPLVGQAEAVMPTARRCGTTTPCASNAAAERTTAPRLRGSVTPSIATSSGGRPELRATAGRAAGGGEQVVGVRVVVRRHLQADALVQSAVRHPVELGLADLEQRQAAVAGQ